MADSSVAVTAGSGTAIDTRTEATNGNHRQVVVLGDPATNAGVAPVDATNGLSVTLTTALPAGTAAIGKLAANSGVDIGDVDVPTIGGQAPNFGAGTVGAGTLRMTLGSDDPAVTSLALLDDVVFAEDVAATAADKGLAILAVRRDANTSLVGTDNDYANLQVNATGELKVAQIQALPAGTNAIGKLAANSGVDIGDVDVLTIGGQSPTFGAGAVAAGTLRVTLASDSPGVSSASGLTYGQNALSTTQEQVLASNSSRIFAEVKNLDTSITVYLGDDTSVTSSNGHALKAGESFAFEGYTGPIHAIAASGTPTVSYMEW